MRLRWVARQLIASILISIYSIEGGRAGPSSSIFYLFNPSHLYFFHSAFWAPLPLPFTSHFLPPFTLLPHPCPPPLCTTLPHVAFTAPHPPPFASFTHLLRPSMPLTPPPPRTHSTAQPQHPKTSPFRLLVGFMEGRRWGCCSPMVVLMDGWVGWR